MTGAGGFLGSNLMEIGPSVGGIELRGTTRADGDLRVERDVKALIERTQPERIVHLAAALAKGSSPESFNAQWDDTLCTGVNVVKCAAAAGVRHVVISGSVDELGNVGGVLDIDARSCPRSPYGLAKTLLREYASYWTRTAPLRIDWFRPFVVYGPGQTRGDMLIPTAFRAAVSGQPASFSDGVQTRDFIHVADVARWLLMVLRAPLPEKDGLFRIHHLGAGAGVEVRAVLAAIAEEFPRSNFKVGALPRRSGEPLCEISAPYASEEPCLRDWRPAFDWRSGIANTAEWWRRTSRL